LKVHVRNVKTDPEVNLATLARGTPGFSGADLANLVNEAALLAARYGKEFVQNEDFEMAKDKVLMGVERRSLIISEQEKRSTAYHEAGHALIAKLLPGTDPVHKVTIIPRGRALGVTQQLPIDDRHNYSEDYILKRIIIMMGGRAAEDLKLNTFTTGASNDLSEATQLARKMVTEWGMSSDLGPVTFGKKDEHIFIGREFAQQQDISQKTMQVIDSEIQGILTDAYKKALDLLSANTDKLQSLFEALLEHEVLDSSQIDQVVGISSPEERSPKQFPDQSTKQPGKDKPEIDEQDPSDQLSHENSKVNSSDTDDSKPPSINNHNA